ncbi:MAG: hypothetical protein JRI29_06885 [Deltaproteobacteria bacterium]|nr:hypothetical protein [Deltaproteobacteria bacterium]
MRDRDNSNSSGKFPNITHLIRSVQVLEGNPDCFGNSDGNCDRLDCAWRELCLKESQKERSRNEGGGDPQK